MTDEELALKARQGDTKALNDLFGKYKNLVNKISRSYFLLGGEFEDIIQEGMIGLYKAIQNFSDNKNASFKTFASMCIKHQIISAIKVASSQKNMVLSSALPISEQNDEEDDSLEIILPSSLPQPDQTVFEKERIAVLQE